MAERCFLKLSKTRHIAIKHWNLFIIKDQTHSYKTLKYTHNQRLERVTVKSWTASRSKVNAVLRHKGAAYFIFFGQIFDHFDWLRFKLQIKRKADQNKKPAAIKRGGLYYSIKLAYCGISLSTPST